MSDEVLKCQQETAQSSLDAMEIISIKANKAKHSHSSGAAIFNDSISDGASASNTLKNISRQSYKENDALEREPFVTRVRYVDENDNERVLYFCRGGTGSFSAPKISLANSRRNIGRLASLNPGEDFEINLNGIDRYYRVIEKLELAPSRSNGAWDAFNSKFYLGKSGKFTIPSLRSLLDQIGLDLSDEDLFGEEVIFEGFQRDVLTSRYLRDQANLDKFQNDIFRLPLNSQCFLYGPPGTGKTTTLIRRLGQKTDVMALEDNGESHLIRKLEETYERFEDNWIMFFPTDLLKLYVKEAFNKEGIAAPESRIKTWGSYRKQIGISLSVLRSGTDKNGLIISEKESNHLQDETINWHQTEWFDDFYAYQKTEFFEQLKSNCEWLDQQQAVDITEISTPALSALSKFEEQEVGIVLGQLTQLEVAIKQAGDIRKKEAEEAAKGYVRILSRTEASFVKDLQENSDLIRKEISDQKLSSDDSVGELDIDDDTDESRTNRKAPLLLVNAIQAFASSITRGRKLSSNSYNARIIDWLGKERLPDEALLNSIGKKLEERRNLRPLYRCSEKYVRFSRRIYSRYRADRLAKETWYISAPTKNSIVHPFEVDLILLAMFKSTASILKSLPDSVAAGIKNTGTIGALSSVYKAQVFIDEATDFSAVQLAIMYELSDPALRSIFLSGDFNQRLTKVGVKTKKELKWAVPGIDQYPIAIAYRQTTRLKELSQSIVSLDGGKVVKLDSPEGFQDANIKPAIGENLETIGQTTQWLADRIFEIDSNRGDQARPTIAVLVNSDAEAKMLAEALSERLAEINIDAIACVDGASIGDDNDVRIYDKQYIKGLEFEAVFFVGIDELQEQSADLFLKYLYVGSSRAATYFAMTAKKEIPESLNSLRNQFSENWRNI